MISLTRKILALLTRSERAQLGRLYVSVLLTSFLEVVGISSIMPFIAIVADPSIIDRTHILRASMQYLGMSSVNEFTILLGVGSLVLLVASNLALAIVNWHLMQFTYGLSHTISSRLLANYLSRGYEQFLRSNTADAKKNVLDEVVQMVNSATVPFMQAMAKIPVVLLILVMLLVVDPLLASLVTLAFGGMYLLLYLVLRAWLSRIGRTRLDANATRFRVAHEALDAIVDIKLLGKERHYHALYDDASRRSARAQAMSMTLAMTPRYALEAIAFGAILSIVIYMLSARGGLGDALPVITLYAVAGYRLMPALQLIFSGLAKARFAESSLDLLRAELPPDETEPMLESARALDDRRVLSHQLRFAGVHFAFHGHQADTVRDLSFDIAARTIVGIAGETGSGKTTVANLLMGLLRPTLGQITIDGVPLDETNTKNWQRNIGYVPQQIYLADATVTANIALGEPLDRVDLARIVAAARIANIHDFVVEELPDKYNTIVGERGARLSGGQRQRIAIARALYHDPDVLVFDEATSALDGVTESIVMDAINRLTSRKTIIVIAHRIDTLRQADAILVMESGAIVDHGTFEELVGKGRLTVATSSRFSTQ